MKKHGNKNASSARSCPPENQETSRDRTREIERDQRLTESDAEAIVAAINSARILDSGAEHCDAKGLCGCDSAPGVCNASMMEQLLGDLLSTGVHKIKGVGDVLAGWVECQNSVRGSKCVQGH